MGLATKLKSAALLIRYMHPAWLLSRTLYWLKLQSGYFSHAQPCSGWNDTTNREIFIHSTHNDAQAYKRWRLEHGPRFFFGPTELASIGKLSVLWDHPECNPMREARHLADGSMELWGKYTLQTGFPPQWHQNKISGCVAPSRKHWSCIPDFGYGDIKVIWEMSRFPFAFALVRAYARTGRDEYGELFWLAFEDWIHSNLPMSGVNWKCGQEIAFRLIAWCFAAYGLLGSPTSTGPRLLTLSRAMYYFGQRIQANISYALSQKNNHGISEAAGLWTIGILFPELKMASAWRRLGRDLLEMQAQELISDDGCFSQLSSNYHRLMLDLYTWVISLGRINGQSFSTDLTVRLKKALYWAYQLMDTQSGGMPNSGGNDGALLFPLTNCGRNDHRPSLQALSYLLDGQLLFPSGPWDEQGLWLFGPQFLLSRREMPSQSDFIAAYSGFNVLRNNDSWAVLRCGHYSHRPVHADLLHLDVWWRGQNIALDPGSFSYNAQKPWAHSLSDTLYHNTITLDQKNQMYKVGRFMWLPWANSHLVGAGRSAKGHLAWMEGVHLGYQKCCHGSIHRRSVINIANQWWLVLDFLEQGSWRSSRLHWLLKDAPYQWRQQAAELILDYPRGKYQVKVGPISSGQSVELVRADNDSPRGWVSTHYQCKQPALSLSLESPGILKNYWTIMGPAGFTMETRKGIFHLEADDLRAWVELRPGRLADRPSSVHLTLRGRWSDFLDLR
jgi:asparagine synthase (glutamine-hydrolysing)